MGERVDTILAVGWPESDLARRVGQSKRLPYGRTALVIYHPDGPRPGAELAELVRAGKELSSRHAAGRQLGEK